MNDTGLVFSGYARCVKCNKLGMTFEFKTACKGCKQSQQLIYGVMHQNQFIDYGELKRRVNSGQTFIDGTHAGLRITKNTFELRHAKRTTRRI